MFSYLILVSIWSCDYRPVQGGPGLSHSAAVNTVKQATASPANQEERSRENKMDGCSYEGQD